MLKIIEEIRENHIKQLNSLDQTINTESINLISQNLVNTLIEYIRQSRPIAEPNANFVNQLIKYITNYKNY